MELPEHNDVVADLVRDLDAAPVDDVAALGRLVLRMSQDVAEREPTEKDHG